MDGSAFNVLVVDSDSTHQPESKVLLWAGLGSNKIMGQADDLFMFAGAGTLPAIGLPGHSRGRGP